MRDQHTCFLQSKLSVCSLEGYNMKVTTKQLHIVIYITIIRMDRTFKVLTHMKLCSSCLKPNIQNQ
jgi:hypothetical protein